MTPQKMAEKLKKRMGCGLPTDEVIELCFSVMQQHPEKIEQCRAAVILSGIVKSGLGKRTQDFLDQNKKLPKRAQEILRANIMRMECH